MCQHRGRDARSCLCRAPHPDAAGHCPASRSKEPLPRDPEQQPPGSRSEAEPHCVSARSNNLLGHDPRQRATAPRYGARTSWVTTRRNETLPRDTEQRPVASRYGARHSTPKTSRAGPHGRQRRPPMGAGTNESGLSCRRRTAGPDSPRRSQPLAEPIQDVLDELADAFGVLRFSSPLRERASQRRAHHTEDCAQDRVELGPTKWVALQLSLIHI